MTTDQILIGIGLTLVLAVGCQVAAGRLHVPALILLLPVGFTAGARSRCERRQRADDVLPVTFLVIVLTIGLYGLMAVPVARRPGVVRSAWSRLLLVGDEDWMIRLGRVLQAGGVDVLMWAGLRERRAQIRDAGLEPAPGELLAAATGRGAELGHHHGAGAHR